MELDPLNCTICKAHCRKTLALTPTPRAKHLTQAINFVNSVTDCNRLDVFDLPMISKSSLLGSVMEPTQILTPASSNDSCKDARRVIR
jgi:hypothetical protein